MEEEHMFIDVVSKLIKLMRERGKCNIYTDEREFHFKQILMVNCTAFGCEIYGFDDLYGFQKVNYDDIITIDILFNEDEDRERQIKEVRNQIVNGLSESDLDEL